MAKSFDYNRNVFDNSSARKIKCTNNIFGNFLTKSSLYNEIEITQDNILELADLIGGHVKLDVYCPACKENRVFSCEPIPYYWQNDMNGEITMYSLEDEILTYQKLKMETDSNPDDWKWTNHTIDDDTRIMVFQFFCAMDPTHRLDYVVLTQGNKMKKIGQYPSVADLSSPELKDYKRVMTEEDAKELRRANGLFASGIGIGSFVYLRRIFERIITAASKESITEGKITEEAYNKSRVDEKINMLADYLPKLLVNNTVFYGIVSKGIHELTEDECLEFFPVMQQFIIMILREKEKMRKDKEDEAQLIKDLNKISSKIS